MSSNPVQFPREHPLLTVTHPSAFEWIVELHNGEDNRLTEHFIQAAILPALDHVEHEWLKSPALEKSKYAKGSLIIVGKRSQEKFFSNGFQYEQVLEKPEFISSQVALLFLLVPAHADTNLIDTYNVLLSRLLSYPIPTIAALNGHVFAAGFMLALACDYRVIRSDKDRRIWGCMNEVHFGAPLPPSFSALLSKKISDQNILRKIALEGHRFTPSELVRIGLVDEVVDGDVNALLQSASKFAEKWSQNSTTGVWGLIKHGLFSDVIQVCSERNTKVNNTKPRL